MEHKKRFYVDAYIRKIVHPYAADHEYRKTRPKIYPQRRILHAQHYKEHIPEIHREYMTLANDWTNINRIGSNKWLGDDKYSAI